MAALARSVGQNGGEGEDITAMIRRTSVIVAEMIAVKEVRMVIGRRGGKGDGLHLMLMRSSQRIARRVRWLSRMGRMHLVDGMRRRDEL